jgi:hypothetical protein
MYDEIFHNVGTIALSHSCHNTSCLIVILQRVPAQHKQCLVARSLNIVGRDDYALVIALRFGRHGTVLVSLPNHNFHDFVCNIHTFELLFTSSSNRFLRPLAFLFFIDYKKLSHYTPRRRLGERRYSSYSFSTSALDGGEWSASRPGRALAQGEGTLVPILQEAGWAPEPVWTQRLE